MNRTIHKLHYELGGIAMLNILTELLGSVAKKELLIEKFAEIQKKFKEKADKEFEVKNEI